MFCHHTNCIIVFTLKYNAYGFHMDAAPVTHRCVSQWRWAHLSSFMRLASEVDADAHTNTQTDTNIQPIPITICRSTGRGKWGDTLQTPCHPHLPPPQAAGTHSVGSAYCLIKCHIRVLNFFTSSSRMMCSLIPEGTANFSHETFQGHLRDSH